MPKRRRRKQSSALTPTIVVLNILIVAVIGLLIFFVYRFMTTEEEIPERTTPTTTTIATIPDETISEIIEITETTESISITKATTTTPETVTSKESEAEITTNGKVGEYSQSYFLNDIFIGDSIMTGYSAYGYLPYENVVAKIGLNPESIFTTEINDEYAVDTIKAYKPTHVNIMLGTNGMGFLSADYMANQMGKLIDEIKAASPESVIKLMSIPPVTAVHESNHPDENMNKINSYNKLLKELAEDKEVIFVDVCTLLKDDTGYMAAAYAEEDGLHFLPAAYGAVLSLLQNI